MHHRALIIAAVLAGWASGCSCADSHTRDDDGGIPSGDGAIVEAPFEPVEGCLPTSAPTLDLGPEAECETVELVTDTEDNTCLLGGERMSSGTGVRVVRRAAGAVYLRSTGCSQLVTILSDVDCRYCAVAPNSAMPTSLGGFPDHGLRELHLRPPTTAPDCDTLVLEACFDPDYGPSPFAP